jgi:hypothetical protein
MNHEKPAFRKEKQGTYCVLFETGYEETVEANSQRDAMLKTQHLQGSYGPFKKAYMKRNDTNKRKSRERKSYAQQQAQLFQ